MNQNFNQTLERFENLMEYRRSLRQEEEDEEEKHPPFCSFVIDFSNYIKGNVKPIFHKNKKDK